MKRDSTHVCVSCLLLHGNLIYHGLAERQAQRRALRQACRSTIRLSVTLEVTQMSYVSVDKCICVMQNVTTGKPHFNQTLSL